LIFIVATGFITVAAPLPVLPLYVHAFISSNTFFIGTIVGLQSISTILSRRFAGNLADERGPKYAVILGLTTCSIAAVFSMFAGFDGCGVAASFC
jgi:MFS family permease